MRRAFAALLAFTLAGCGASVNSDSTTGPVGGGLNITGSYTLRSVDGQPLPAAAPDSTVLSGLLTVSDSGWSQVIVVRYAKGGSGSAAGDTLPLAGRWKVDGSTVTFDDGGTLIYSGTYSTTGFNLSSKTSTLVFSK